MSFELRDRDLLGRIGRLRTSSGVVETPALMPVVNPFRQPIPPRRMLEEFRCRIIITNAYLIMRHLGAPPAGGVHGLLDYGGAVATDSGAYQILVHGRVETTPEEVIAFQKRLRPDIAVILDHPTGWGTPRARAEWTVEETLRRAEAAIPLIEGDEILWVGPVQGGGYIDLVERSARSMAALPYPIYALGSPTQVMERYMYPLLVDMIMAAKLNLPQHRPLHLFGAGHPSMFALAVALGCDTFDSAAYAIYARNERYMTPGGTLRLGDLSHLPCPCPVCRRRTAEELREMPREEQSVALAEHNLHVSAAEVDTIKQAIARGALWELLEARSRSHPALASALRRLARYREALERRSPSRGGRGIFIFDSAALARPEVSRHVRRLHSNYSPPDGWGCLLLVPAPAARPFGRSPEFARLLRALEEVEGGAPAVHICFYVAPFGVVPFELSETYPLSQFEVAEPLDRETLEFTADQVARYIEAKKYASGLLLSGAGALDVLVEERCEEAHRRLGRSLAAVRDPDPWSGEALEKLASVLARGPR